MVSIQRKPKAKAKPQRTTPTTPTTSSIKSKSSSSKARRSTISIPLFLLIVAITIGLHRYFRPPISPNTYLSRHEKVVRKRYDVSCYTKKKPSRSKGLFVPGCHRIGNQCGRVVRDHFVTPQEVEQLRQIAEIGMTNRSKLGGPTIMDINTGFVKDGNGLVNIYKQNSKHNPSIFTHEQFDLYRKVIEKIRLAVMEEFDLEVLYFTAPTFLTRLIGNASWTATELHDEYWHPHIDKDNTPHYDFSGLLYLADYEEEFTGGMFAFIDKKTTMKRIQEIEPARGRLVMFTSGKENFHQVRKVKNGTRYLMSMWFSCDPKKEFTNFLDGHMHQHFN